MILSTITIAEATLIGSILTPIGLIIVAVIANNAKKSAEKGAKFGESIDNAVNHAEREGRPRLADLMYENHLDIKEVAKTVERIDGWRAGWDGSPWRDGPSIQAWVDKNDASHASTSKKLNDLDKRAKKAEGICADARMALCDIGKDPKSLAEKPRQETI